MTPESYRPQKIFTIEQANATLPLVRAITTDLVALAQEIHDRRLRLDSLGSGRNPRQNDLYATEVAQIEESLERDVLKLRDYINELHELGVESKGPLMGLIDFPTMLDGRLVYLCWKLGEKEILHWHELDAGFSGRRPLTANTVAGDESEEWRGGKA